MTDRLPDEVVMVLTSATMDAAFVDGEEGPDDRLVRNLRAGITEIRECFAGRERLIAELRELVAEFRRYEPSRGDTDAERGWCNGHQSAADSLERILATEEE